METQKSTSNQSDMEKEKKKKNTTELAKSGSLNSDYTTKLQESIIYTLY